MTFSPSLLSRLAGPCPRRSLIGWLEEPDRLSPAMARGVAFHAAANLAIDWLEQRGETPDLPSIVEPAFHRAWDRTPWANGNDDGDLRDVLHLVEQLMAIWRPVENAWPALVEHSVVWEDRARAIRVRARLDRTYRLADGSARVVDFKSGGSGVEPLTLRAQALAAEASLPERPIAFTYYHARGKLIRDYEPSSGDLTDAIDAMTVLAGYIRAEAAPPAESPIPECEGCTYRPGCPLWERALDTVPSAPAEIREQPR